MVQPNLVDQVVVVVVVVVAVIEAVTVYSGYRAEADHWTLAEVAQHCCLAVQLMVDIDSAEETVVDFVRVAAYSLFEGVVWVVLVED